MLRRRFLKSLFERSRDRLYRIYNWYNKGSKPTIEALKAVCDVLNVSLSCFFAETINESISAQEEELLTLFRALTPEQKELCKKLLIELNKASV